MVERRQPGLLGVLALGLVVVVVVLAVEAVTTFMAPAREALDAFPIVILVLLGGTAWVLWRIASRPGPGGA